MGYYYINKLKENLKSYNTEVKSINAYYQNDKERYIGDILEGRLAEKAKKKISAKEKIERQIVSDFNDIKRAVSKASFVKPDIVNSDIYKMFYNNMISLSNEEVQHYVDTAFENGDFTTLRAIKKYADTNEVNVIIPTPETVIEAYSKFYSSALEVVDPVDGSDISSMRVECFADEEFGRELFNAIGTCDFPHEYRIPDTMGHAYDAVLLTKYGQPYSDASPMKIKFGDMS